MSIYTEEISLPSKGYLYDDIPEVIKIKAIQTKEEKMIFGSSTVKALDDVMNECLIEPEGIDVQNMITPDKIFYLVRLRVLTYGELYPTSHTCRNCGHKHEELDINLDEDLILHQIEEDFSEPISIELPRSKDKLEMRLLRGKDMDGIKDRANMIRNRSSEDVGNIEMVLRKAYRIDTVNGESLPKPELQQYVEELNGMDSSYLDHVINEIKIGYEENANKTCKKCGSQMKVPIRMSREFFRATFR